MKLILDKIVSSPWQSWLILMMDVISSALGAGLDAIAELFAASAKFLVNCQMRVISMRNENKA